MQYIKFMEKGCVGPYSGVALDPGVWLPKIEGELEMCRNGYHFCEVEDFHYWIAAELYAVEARGEYIAGDNKICAAEIKMTRIEAWNDRTARLFAADCAERVLPIYEKHGKSDAPRLAVQAARDFANGLISADDMAAAGGAAGTAAGGAAGAASRGAARTAAWTAAWTAARTAAWTAAGTAAGGAAGAASRTAAWTAARTASRGAARTAARTAAWTAAWTATWDAAGGAERKWQTERFLQYISGEVK